MMSFSSVNFNALRCSTSDKWDRKYSREKGAFPAQSVRRRLYKIVTGLPLIACTYLLHYSCGAPSP